MIDKVLLLTSRKREGDSDSRVAWLYMESFCLDRRGIRMGQL